jgi:hypothetical protein
VPPIVHDALASGGRALDQPTRVSMEKAFGFDFGRVRVHTDSLAAESARSVAAEAYTVGSDVVFGAGRYAPASAEGRKLIAHELAHVVQQRASNDVAGPLRLGAARDEHEREADRAIEGLAGRGAATELPAAGGRRLQRRLVVTPAMIPGTGGGTPFTAAVAEAQPLDAPAPDGETAPAAETGRPEPEPEPAPDGEAEAPAAAPALSWELVKRHTWDALWWFCGEHPAGFSTTALLRADGYGDATALTWSITRGADKVAFVGAPTGAEVTVASRAGSVRLDDISVEMREGTAAAAPTYTGTLTVRKPHRLIQRFVRHHANCPPAFPTCPATCPAHWTEIGYRVVDNVGGTIVGATVNEHFPSPKVSDQPNDWVSPASFSTVPVWPNTDGTFIDFWTVWCGTPSPVNPGDPHDNDSVDRLEHEFYVGSRTSGRGCRVQTHTAHRYLGHTLHESIRTPAP